MCRTGFPSQRTCRTIAPGEAFCARLRAFQGDQHGRHTSPDDRRARGGMRRRRDGTGRRSDVDAVQGQVPRGVDGEADDRRLPVVQQAAASRPRPRPPARPPTPATRPASRRIASGRSPRAPCSSPCPATPRRSARPTTRVVKAASNAQRAYGARPVSATMKGANVVPKAGDATGRLSLRLNEGKRRACFTLSTSGIGAGGVIERQHPARRAEERTAMSFSRWVTPSASTRSTTRTPCGPASPRCRRPPSGRS